MQLKMRTALQPKECLYILQGTHFVSVGKQHICNVMLFVYRDEEQDEP